MDEMEVGPVEEKVKEEERPMTAGTEPGDAPELDGASHNRRESKRIAATRQGQHFFFWR
jgi:hypothetical protein